MPRTKQIKKAASKKAAPPSGFTELEFQTLKKDYAQLKQSINEHCDRERIDYAKMAKEPTKPSSSLSRQSVEPDNNLKSKMPKTKTAKPKKTKKKAAAKKAAPAPVYTELEYAALMKENALLKQTIDDHCEDREREIIAKMEISEEVINYEEEYLKLKEEMTRLEERYLKTCEDFSQLLITGKWSDLTITVGGKNFAAHKAILSARSSIFEAWLEQNCTENHLVINNMSMEVFEALLVFIYTGRVPSLEQQMAEELLTIADKYQMEQLKWIAEDNLCTGLSLESVARLLSLAEAANSSKLMDKCLELINSHASSSVTRSIASLAPLARLPGPCLLALFRQLPPADQLSARKVCHRWSNLVPVANKLRPHSITIAFNRSLDIAEDRFNCLSHGPDWKPLKLLRKADGSPLISIRPLTKWNSLQLSTLNKETVSQIMAIFPVVKELQLCADINISVTEMNNDGLRVTTPPLQLLLRLLEQWRHQLTALKLSVDISTPFEHLLKESIDRFGAGINSLPALKHLSIDLSLNSQPFLPKLSILSKLVEFNTNLDLSKIKTTLMSLKQAPTRISFKDYYRGFTGQPSLTLSKTLRQRIVRFDSVIYSDYRTICEHFLSLTSVWFHLSDTTLRFFLTYASRLTELIRLNLYIHFPSIPPDGQPPRTLPQLKSVKLLQLIFTMQSHHDLEPLNLARTMPNVQVIKFEIAHRCITCGISNQSPTPDYTDKAKHCLRQMFGLLKSQCGQLHSITHNLEESLGTAEELLADM